MDEVLAAIDAVACQTSSSAVFGWLKACFDILDWLVAALRHDDEKVTSADMDGCMCRDAWNRTLARHHLPGIGPPPFREPIMPMMG
ncbi:hypothetical protein NI454_15115 [Brevundimonas diminuta]|uniref:hypothetical protein n=1 Tax=Brevundimonas diminuta TaxID=293 RepID=UPI0020972840|nr:MULTISPECIES: hypothetical protein [Brevundimonas]MCO8031281.1 hypothetical protein [Brevundimonas diminuta]